jgi:hypothetical protein
VVTEVAGAVKVFTTLKDTLRDWFPGVMPVELMEGEDLAKATLGVAIANPKAASARIKTRRICVRVQRIAPSPKLRTTLI